MPTNSSYREIVLTQGQVAIVSAEDFEHLSQWNWYAMQTYRKTWYAYRRSAEQTKLSMHRYVLGLTTNDKSFADHINGNGLDNRRENLRISDVRTNQRNQRKHADSANPFKGIFYQKGHWYARVSGADRRICSHPHDTPEAAYATYCAMALEHYGEFARLV